MREAVRIAKTKTNVFSEQQLQRRKACHDMNVGELLRSLSNKGLITPVKRRVWRTTSLGREIEHYLQRVEFDVTLGYRVISR